MKDQRFEELNQQAKAAIEVKIEAAKALLNVTGASPEMKDFVGACILVCRASLDLSAYSKQRVDELSDSKDPCPNISERQTLRFDGTGDSCDEIAAWLGHSGKWCVWNSNTFSGGKVYSLAFGWTPFNPGDTIMSIPSGYVVIFARTASDNFLQLPSRAIGESAPEGGK